MRLFFTCLIAVVCIGGCSSSGSTTTGSGVDGGAGGGGGGGGTQDAGDPDGGGASNSDTYPDGTAKHRVILEADLSQGANGASCTLPARPLLTMGVFPTSTTTAVPVDDESGWNAGTASVSCSVIPAAGAFSVKLQASLTGANGGSVTVEGTVTPSGMQTGLKGIVEGGANTFSQLDCTMTYDSAEMGVAAGRIWGTLRCAKSVDLKASQTCQVAAQVRFENCTQQ